MTDSTKRRLPSKASVFIILALCVASAFLVFRIKIDNRLDRMLDEDDALAETYNAFLDEYGSDEFIIAAMSGRPLFDEESLDAMVDALERIEAIEHVEQVSGIPTIYRDNYGMEDAEALEDEMTSTPFFHGLFLNPEATVAGLFIQTEILDEPAARGELVDALYEALTPLEDIGFRTDLVGVPVFNSTLNRLSFRESLRTFPIGAVASLIVLLVLMRSVKAAVAVIGCGALSLLLTLGFAALLDKPLNVITSALPLLLWVLSIANCIHIVCRYQFYRRESDSIDEALEQALDETRFPCTLSAITTACGFFSLIVADIGPVRELGVLMAAGMMISLAVNLIMGPTFLRLLNVPAANWAMGEGGSVFESLTNGLIRYRALVLAFFTIFVGLGLYSTTQLSGESDTLTFLPQDSRIVQSYDFVTENLTGVRTLEVLIDTPGSWLNAEYWPSITNLTATVSAHPGVPRVVSPLDFLKKMNQWDNDLDPEFYRLPETTEEAVELLDLLEEDERMEINRLVADDDEQIRLSIIVRSLDNETYDGLVETVLELGEALPDPLGYTLTGVVQRMDNMSERMVISQIKSFGLAFFMVFLVILIGLRSLKIMLVSIVPNAIPILSAFMVMAVMGIPLDAATTMVASIALGIAVDDTVHLLSAYRREIAQGKGNHDAIRGAMSAVGPSVTVTTATACVGFFALTLSVFVPIFYFGFLSGIAMLVALLADLLLIPAMLSLRRESG